MVSRVTVMLIDDLDGSDASQSVEFVYKNKVYTLDLNDDNASKLDDALAPYIAAAEKAGRAQSSTGGRAGRRQTVAGSGGSEPAPDYTAKEVRAWALANGVEVPARGRIPSRVIEKYKASPT